MAESGAAGEPALLIYGDSVRSAALRHELPLAIIDPLLYAIVDGRPQVMVNVLERERIAEVQPEAVLHDLEALGIAELRESGIGPDEMMLELASRAAAAMGLRAAVVDPEFPLAVADRLRSDGIELTPDADAFHRRRRAKSATELEGIRRAQSAAEAGMAAAAAALRAATPEDGELLAGGEPLTAEAVRAALREACAARGAPTPPDVMVTSVRAAFGHDPGSGPLPADLPITVDLWPCDEESGCWADMTRTFVVGEVSDEVRVLEQLVAEALERAREAVRPGVTGRELHAIACDVFEAAGHRTQRTGPGEDPTEGFQFSLGHGVGLEVHEEPSLGQVGHEPLVAGDVLALEPGIWLTALGEVRFEDLVLVTEDGHELLTDYPYSLSP